MLRAQPSQPSKPLVGCQLEEAHGLPLLHWKTALTLHAGEPKNDLRLSKSLVGSCDAIPTKLLTSARKCRSEPRKTALAANPKDRTVPCDKKVDSSEQKWARLVSSGQIFAFPGQTLTFSSKLAEPFATSRR